MEKTDNTPESAKTTPDTTASTPPPAPDKPTNSTLTTALIVIIVVLLFVMLMLSVNGKLFQPRQDDQNNQDLTELEARNAQLRADANAERARKGLPPIPEDASSARMAADRIQRDATTLASLAGQWQTALEEKDKQLRTLETAAATQRDHTASLYKRINELETRLASSASAADQVLRLTNDLKMAQNQIDMFRKQLAEMQGRPTNETVAALRKQLSDSMDKTSKLQMQIDGLLAAAKNKTDKSQYDSLLAEAAKLRTDNRSQRYEIQRLRAELDRARLFIESDKDLPAEAARLFAKLKTLENANKQQLEAAYENIRATLGAEIIHRQTFASGSSQIKFDREKMIQDILGKRRDADSFFLVVGYASKSGGTANNRKLSAKRATTVASVVNLLKAPGQQVKAVYLGETTRFSPTNELDNQICEIWEIKK